MSNIHPGKGAPYIHVGNHVKPLHYHRAATGDQTDDDSAKKLPFAECRAAGHAGAAASVHTRQTG